MYEDRCLAGRTRCPRSCTPFLNERLPFVVKLAQAIAYASFGHYVAWLRRITLDLLPKLPDINPEILGLINMRRSPDFAEELLVRDYLAGVFDERAQDFIFLAREPDFVAFDGYHAAGKIHR